MMLLVLAAGFFADLDAKRPTDEQRARWMAEMQQYRREFVVKSLQLSDEQKAKFLPLYDAMNREILKVQNEARAIDKAVKAKGSAATDADYRKASAAMFQLKSREGAIETAYYEKFKGVLSARQLYELKRAEDKFAREMMRRHREKKKKD